MKAGEICYPHQLFWGFLIEIQFRMLSVQKYSLLVKEIYKSAQSLIKPQW
jgi:hypothetical protein